MIDGQRSFGSCDCGKRDPSLVLMELCEEVCSNHVGTSKLKPLGRMHCAHPYGKRRVEVPRHRISDLPGKLSGCKKLLNYFLNVRPTRNQNADNLAWIYR